MIYEALLTDFRVAFRADEPGKLDEYWTQYALHDSASGKLWMDAYLAAFARAAKFEMVTFDRAFQQFDGLRLTLLSTA